MEINELAARYLELGFAVNLITEFVGYSPIIIDYSNIKRCRFCLFTVEDNNQGEHDINCILPKAKKFLEDMEKS